MKQPLERGKRKYYYRRRRGTGRSDKEYVASGDEAEAAAKRDAEAREHRKELERAAEMLASLDEIVEMAIEVTLSVAGYHRHDRGKWRKKRVKP